MEKEPSEKTTEHLLNPNARIWLGMRQVEPGKTFHRCFVTTEDNSTKTITLCGLGLTETTFKAVRIPIMVEHLLTLPAPTYLDRVVSGYNLGNQSSWGPFRPKKPHLDGLFPELYTANH